MAIWQVEFYVVSENKSENDSDITLWHEDITSKATDVCFLSRKKGWCNTIIQYGESDKNCIELIINDNYKVEEIGIRLDIRDLNTDMINDIIKYVKELSGKIFYQDKLYTLDKSTLLSIISKSQAFEFCRNPTEFIRKLEKT